MRRVGRGIEVSFNSTLVRLKADVPPAAKMGDVASFQFHAGSIKGGVGGVGSSGVGSFQFHAGSIKGIVLCQFQF